MAYDGAYLALLQQEQIDKILKEKENARRRNAAYSVMRQSNFNPQTTGGFFLGQLFGDAINRWIDKGDNTKVYQQGNNPVNTAIGVVQGSPEAISNAIQGGKDFINNAKQNVTQNVWDAMGQAAEGMDLGGTIKDTAGGLLANGLTGDTARGIANTVSDFVKNVGDNFTREDLLKGIFSWGGNS